MAKINFNEKWSVLRGVKATSVDFAGPDDTSSAVKGAYGGKGKVKGGKSRHQQALEGDGTGKKGKLKGMQCRRPDGGVYPGCEDYNPNLEGRDKLLEGSDMNTIRQNFKLLKSGRAGYHSNYLQGGAKGEIPTDAQAWAIAFKKANLKGEGSGVARNTHSIKDEFYNRHLPRVHRSSFENHDQAHREMQKAVQQHDAEVKKLTSQIEDYLNQNPGATPEQMIKDLKLNSHKELDTHDVNAVVKEVTGHQMGQKFQQSSDEDAGQALVTLGQELGGALNNNRDSIGPGKMKNWLVQKIQEAQGANIDPSTPEGYQQLLDFLQGKLKKANGLQVDPKMLMAALQASGFAAPQTQVRNTKRQISKLLHAALDTLHNGNKRSRGSREDWSNAAQRRRTGEQGPVPGGPEPSGAPSPEAQPAEPSEAQAPPRRPRRRPAQPPQEAPTPEEPGAQAPQEAPAPEQPGAQAPGQTPPTPANPSASVNSVRNKQQNQINDFKNSAIYKALSVVPGAHKAIESFLNGILGAHDEEEPQSQPQSQTTAKDSGQGGAVTPEVLPPEEDSGSDNGALPKITPILRQKLRDLSQSDARTYRAIDDFNKGIEESSRRFADMAREQQQKAVDRDPQLRKKLIESGALPKGYKKGTPLPEGFKMNVEQKPQLPGADNNSLPGAGGTTGNPRNANGRSGTTSKKKKGNNAQNSGDKGASNSSEYNFSAPYGWSFCEETTPKTNVVGGEDANRNLVKIPDGWGSR